MWGKLFFGRVYIASTGWRTDKHGRWDNRTFQYDYMEMVFSYNNSDL